MIEIDFKNEMLKASPIVGTAAADGASRFFFGLTLNEWFYVAAIAYTVVQMGVLIYKTYKTYRKGGEVV
ncbi:class II holin [Kosakonia phage Kc166A]|uniref:Holin n=1 Tax=Kosakonia phage Kc166A TaxID=2801381 RepID=A0AAE7RIM0_9CAUD|nr:class II holin [Kosakonia phage Kc166A]